MMLQFKTTAQLISCCRYSMKTTLEAAFQTYYIDLTWERTTACPHCGGKGAAQPHLKNCTTCGGDGLTGAKHDHGSAECRARGGGHGGQHDHHHADAVDAATTVQSVAMRCPVCRGHGELLPSSYSVELVSKRSATRRASAVPNRSGAVRWGCAHAVALRAAHTRRRHRHATVRDAGEVPTNMRAHPCPVCAGKGVQVQTIRKPRVRIPLGALPGYRVQYLGQGDRLPL